MFCTNCGKELEAGDVFCVHCGARQETSTGNEAPGVEAGATGHSGSPAGVVTPASGNTLAQEITTMSLFNGWKSLSGISGLILGLYFVLGGHSVIWGAIKLFPYLFFDHDYSHDIQVFFISITRIYGLYLILRPVLPRHISLRAMETLLVILYAVLLGFDEWVLFTSAFDGLIHIDDILIYSILILLLCLCYFKTKKRGIYCALFLIVASCILGFLWYEGVL